MTLGTGTAEDVKLGWEIPVGLLPIDDIETAETKSTTDNPSNFFQPSSRINCSRTIAEQLYYDWIEEINMDGEYRTFSLPS